MEGTLDDKSNSLRMKRSIMEVLPTPVSPNRTILNLVSQRDVLSSMCTFLLCMRGEMRLYIFFKIMVCMALLYRHFDDNKFRQMDGGMTII
jgi:hypothetical protein